MLLPPLTPEQEELHINEVGLHQEATDAALDVALGQLTALTSL